MGRVTPENLERVFTYQKPTSPETIEKYLGINESAESLAAAILELAPECADRSEAIRCVRMARMWANSAIALEGEV